MAFWRAIAFVFCAMYGTLHSLQLELPPALEPKYYLKSCDNYTIPSVENCGDLTAACVDFQNFIVNFQRQKCNKNFTNTEYLLDMSGEFISKYNSSGILERVVTIVDLCHKVLKYISVAEESNKKLNALGLYSPVNLGQRIDKVKDIASETETSENFENVINSIKDLKYRNDQMAAKFNLSKNILDGKDNISLELDKVIGSWKKVEDFKRDRVFLHTVTFIILPIVIAILFLVGICGNLLLAFIFFVNRDMRTRNNTMLMNLVAADCVSLVFNLPFSYATNLDTWATTPFTCQLFYFFQTLTIVGSTYCVVLLTYERYRAIASSVVIRNKSLSPLLMTSVFWLVVLLYSALNFAFVTSLNQFCLNEPVFVYVNFVLIFVIPVGTIVVLQCLSAKMLKKSVKNVPGERMGKDKMLKNRTLASRALIGMALLFSFSYFPSYVMAFINLNERFSIGRLVYFLLFYSQFLNSVLNPIMLYFLSSKFRELFNYYLCCKYRTNVKSKETGTY